MILKSIEERIEASLAEAESQEYFDEYLKAVLENGYRADEKLQRSILFLLFFIAIFELLTRASITEASLGPFKISDLSLVHKYLPLIIAYFYCSVIAMFVMRSYLGRVYRGGIKKRHKSIHSNNLDLFVGPVSPLLVGQIVKTYSIGKISKIADFVSFAVVTVLIIGPLAFEAYAFYRCFLRYEMKDLNMWASTLGSTIFLLEAILILFHVDQRAIASES